MELFITTAVRTSHPTSFRVVWDVTLCSHANGYDMSEELSVSSFYPEDESSMFLPSVVIDLPYCSPLYPREQ
jgi:hypothetical protein